MFGSLEPIADCAHVLAVIDDALDHLDALTKESFIDADGQQIEIAHYDIEFQNVDFSYGEGKERRQVLHNVNLKIPDKMQRSRYTHLLSLTPADTVHYKEYTPILFSD